MPGRRCAVFSCNNNSVRTKAKGAGIAYHRFPIKNNTLRQEWIRRCARADNFNPDTSQICSVHFSDSDFERDLQNELLGLPLKRVLKKTAVPTLNLSVCANQSDTTSQQPPIKQEPKEEVRDILESHAPDISYIERPLIEASHLHVSEENRTYVENFTESLEAKYSDLLEKFDVLERHHLKFKRDSRKKIKSLQNQLNYYKKKYYIINYNKQSQNGENILSENHC